MPDLSLADLARSSDEQFMEQDRLRSQGIPNFDRMPLKYNPQAFEAWLSSLAPSQNIEDRRGELAALGRPAGGVPFMSQNIEDRRGQPQVTDLLNPSVGSPQQILQDQMLGGPNRYTGQMPQMGQPARPQFYGPTAPRPFIGR
jgi:hypothetical protein